MATLTQEERDWIEEATGTKLAADFEPMHPVKAYQALIDHVNGFGKRGWNQSNWVDTTDEFESFFADSADNINFDKSTLVHGCGAYACIAGEVAIMNGVISIQDINSGKTDALEEEDWQIIARLMGVPEYDYDYDDDLMSLFAGHNTREIVLEELERRLAIELAK